MMADFVRTATILLNGSRTCIVVVSRDIGIGVLCFLADAPSMTLDHHLNWTRISLLCGEMMR